MSERIEEPGEKSRLPTSYKRASWRGTLPVDAVTERVGLAINVEGGDVLRVGLDLASALDIVATLADALASHQNRRSHSDRSSGMPSAEGSTPGGSKA